MHRSIVIIGGFQSAWPLYLLPARHLATVTGYRAVTVRLMPWHWWAAMRDGDAVPLLDRLNRTMQRVAGRNGTAPCTLVGHSAGGLLARLYVVRDGVPGRRYEHAACIDAVVTLGSPHCEQRGTSTGWYLGNAANRFAPGAPYRDAIAYRTVAGHAVEGRAGGSRRQQRAFRNYRAIGGEGDVWGDGTVPVSSAHLQGVENVTLDGVGHSLRFARWYLSSPEIIHRWWA